jgi:hypothetical protein
MMPSDRWVLVYVATVAAFLLLWWAWLYYE